MSRNYWTCDKCGTLVKDKTYHTITEEDLNRKAVITIQGNKYPSFIIFGGLRSFDVGKRLYLINNLLYIENDKQFNERIKSE